ncbi:MAG: hypothetical protein JWM82_4389, partial [Myxococcales bacterium]|nr:hypothetical protein [Myxococcales bacterium]
APRPAGPTPRRAEGAWLTAQPEGCALGQSGPTLKPTDALREARRRARASLITAVEKINQRAVSVVGSSGARDQHHEVILEQVEGWVRRSTIVALWYDDRGTGPNGAPGTAYAAACLADVSPPATRASVARTEAHRAAPAWVYGVASPNGQLCAAGVSGPTMDAEDARANAEASARAELAEGIAAHVKLAAGIFDDETLVGAVTDVPESCRAQAAAARVVASWTDERGVGPVPSPGMSYAFVCASL